MMSGWSDNGKAVAYLAGAYGIAKLDDSSAGETSAPEGMLIDVEGGLLAEELRHLVERRSGIDWNGSESVSCQ